MSKQNIIVHFHFRVRSTANHKDREINYSMQLCHIRSSFIFRSKANVFLIVFVLAFLCIG